MTDAFYSTAAWTAVRERVLARDDGRCTVARLLGGDCGGVLHVHHILARVDHPALALDDDNCATVCAVHHPTWEALRRLLAVLRGDVDVPPCGHFHPYREGRVQCERRRREQIVARRAERLAKAA